MTQPEESIHRWALRTQGRRQVECLLPGADRLDEVPWDAGVPIGTVLVSSGAVVHTEDFVAVARAWHRAPWCPVLLIGNQPPSSADLALITPPGMRVRILSCGFLVGVDELRAAVVPSIPSVAELATWVGLRCGWDARRAILRALENPSRTRDLRLLGLLPPSEWRAIFQTIQCLGFSVSREVSAAAAAHAYGVALKTVSRHCRDYLGGPWRCLTRLVHWEAMLETALRHRGVVAADSAAEPETSLAASGHFQIIC